MEYLFLLYKDPSQPMSPQERDQARSRQWSIMDDTSKRGILRGSSPLQPVSNSVCIRSDAGRLLTTDGPFVETKEALGGYYLIDCRDLEEAKYWAGRMSQTGCATIVEIRQLVPVPARVEDSPADTLVNA
jgi:hypothetical protein